MRISIPARSANRFAFALATIGTVFGGFGCGKGKVVDDWSTHALTAKPQTLRGIAFTVDLPEGLETDALLGGIDMTLAFAQKGALANGIRVSFHREALIAPTTLDEAEKSANALGDRTITKKGPLGKEGFLVVASDGKNSGLFVDSWTAAPDGATIHCVASDTEAAPIANVSGMSAWLEKICSSVNVTGTAPIPPPAAASAAAKP